MQPLKTVCFNQTLYLKVWDQVSSALKNTSSAVIWTQLDSFMTWVKIYDFMTYRTAIQDMYV